MDITKFKLVSSNEEINNKTKPTNEIVELNDELIKSLRDKQVIREGEETIDLPHFEPGQEKIGILTEPERIIFIEMCTIEDSLFEWGREISARAMEKSATFIRSSNTPEDMARKIQDSMVFVDDNEAEEYYAEIYRRDYLNALFWWGVRYRLKCYGANLSIHHGWSVARSGYKYRVTRS